MYTQQVYSTSAIHLLVISFNGDKIFPKKSVTAAHSAFCT